MATYSQSYFNKGSDCVKDFCCETCDEKTIEEGADFFCETCLKLYCGKCIDLHGQLFTKHATYGRDDMRKWPANKEVENFLQRCEIHTDENLILFCKNHSQLSCALCDVHSHRKCPDVELITEAHKNNSTDVQQLSVKVQSILTDLKTLQDNREGHIQFQLSSYKETLQEIHETRRNINEILDDMEKATLKVLNDRLESLQTSLKSDVENCARLHAELKQLYEAAKDVTNKDIKTLSFIANMKCLDKIKQSEKYLKDKNATVVLSCFVFKAYKSIKETLSRFRKLGFICTFPMNYETLSTWTFIKQMLTERV